MKNSNEKIVKENGNKTFAVAVAVIFVIVLGFIAAMLLPPRIVGTGLRDDAIEAFEGAGDDDVVLLADPLYRDGVSTVGKEMIIDGDDKTLIAASVTELLRHSSYSKSESEKLGSWNLNITLKNDEDSVKVYFSEDKIYLTKNMKRYVFKIDKSHSEEYADLVELILKKL